MIGEMSAMPAMPRSDIANGVVAAFVVRPGHALIGGW
jgi:hypothetical protein